MMQSVEDSKCHYQDASYSSGQPLEHALWTDFGMDLGAAAGDNSDLTEIERAGNAAHLSKLSTASQRLSHGASRVWPWAVTLSRQLDHRVVSPWHDIIGSGLHATREGRELPVFHHAVAI